MLEVFLRLPVEQQKVIREVILTFGRAYPEEDCPALAGPALIRSH